jgi:rubrerythrin
MQKLTGKNPEVLVDKLGERLAFERSGVRLYEALLTKYQATPEKLPGMSVEKLTHFRDEEAKHFKLVADALDMLGADPTAQTPGADVTGVESMGLMQVLDDPRTTIPQSLHAVLVAELADHAGWELLIKLAEDMGQKDMAKQFHGALEEEEEHLTHVRNWVEESVRAELR